MKLLVDDATLIELVDRRTRADGIRWVRRPSRMEGPYECYTSEAAIDIDGVRFELRLTWKELKSERGFAHVYNTILHIERSDHLWKRDCTVLMPPRSEGVMPYIVAAVKGYGDREKQRSEALLLRWLGHEAPEPPQEETV
jgi:hypothetical protein